MPAPRSFGGGQRHDGEARAAAAVEGLGFVVGTPGDRLLHMLDIALHDRFYAIRDGIVEDVWPILARGRMD